MPFLSFLPCCLTDPEEIEERQRKREAEVHLQKARIAKAAAASKNVVNGTTNKISPKSSTSSGGRSDESETLHRNIVFQYHKGTCALEYWEPVQLIGEGSISSIHLVKRRKQRVDIPYKERADIMRVGKVKPPSFKQSTESRASLQVFALKSIMKDHIDQERYLEEMRSEIETMSLLDHPNIARVYEAYERRRHIYLIMEYCSGDDLYEKAPYSELQAARILKRIVSAVSYMHEHKVVHRDLKMENIMFETASEDAQVKIIDFGLATKYLSNEYKQMTDRVGTVYTMAPQVLQGVYTSQCDLWSIGVIAFMLLCGEAPFAGRHRRELVDKIMRCDYNMETAAWKNISPDAKDFVKKLLQMNPKKRLTASQALKHPWLAQDLSEPKSSHYGLDDKTTTNFYKAMCSFGKESKLKKVALILIAHQSSVDEVAELRQLFEQHDPTGQGRISYESFRDALQETNLAQEEVDELFASLDVRENGSIEYTEFLAAVMACCKTVNTERIHEAFDRLDSDKTGYISKKNLQDALGGAHISDEMLEEMLVSAGSKQKNSSTDEILVSRDEFVKLFHQRAAVAEECCQIRSEHAPRVKKQESKVAAAVGGACGCGPPPMGDSAAAAAAETQSEDDELGELLVTEDNVVIPGGRNDNAQQAIFVFDEATQSIHKSPGHDGEGKHCAVDC